MILEVAVLSFALSRQPRRCNTSENDQMLTFESNAQTVEYSSRCSIIPEVSVVTSLDVALAKDLSCIGDVRHVLTERAEGNLLVWIAIDHAESYEVRSQVYEKELGLLDGFPEVNFDFNLMPATDRDPRDLATGAQVVYSRPK